MIKLDMAKKIIGAGAMAPSGDNCQPWYFRWGNDTLLIFHDEVRAFSLYNPKNIASYVSMGAVIENITIAARNFGYDCQMTYFPEGNNSSLIAEIKIIETGGSQPESLFPSLGNRSVNRRPYLNKPIDKGMREKILAPILTYEDARLYYIEDKASRKRLAKIVSKADRLLFENKLLHDGLFKWIRWTEEEIDRTRDGMPIDSLELGRWQKYAFRLFSSWRLVSFLNHLGLSKFASRHSLVLIKSSPVICLLTMPHPSEVDYIEGGRILQRIWLTLTSMGISMHPMTGITYLISRLRIADGDGLSQAHRNLLSSAREELQKIIPFQEDGALIMLFRIGYAKPPSCRSPRRPIQEVSNLNI